MTKQSFWSLIAVLINLPADKISPFMRAWKNSNAMNQQVRQIVAAFDLLSRGGESDF
jgi:tRNA nucleotidyltransferase (CCA-adding enzyme)